MCGITGIFSFEGLVDDSRLKAMTDAIKHRGPDGEGFQFNENHCLGLGHRRLSILDLSDAGKQPFVSGDGRYYLTFNGEIYNYIELREQLAEKGETFVSETDTEVLLKMFVHYQEKCLSYLDGMFAFAVWDNKKKCLFCARDRFGEKPFFYCKDNKQLLFASEIKAIWAGGVSKKADPRKCYDYLLFGTVRDVENSTATFYENIKELPAAHYMWINQQGSMELNSYYDIDLSAEPSKLSFKEAEEQFLSMFQQSVAKRLRSDVAVGSSLSGGLDSSAIVGMVNQFKGNEQQQQVFSARFRGYEKDEGHYIQAVLEKYPNIQAHEIDPTNNSVLENLQKIIHSQDEPFNSLSIAAQFEVFKKVAQSNVTVLLDGQGADEFLAGYQSFHQAYLSELKHKSTTTYKHEINAFKTNTNWKLEEENWRNKLKGNRSTWYKKLAQIRRKSLSTKSDYFVGIHPDLVKKYQKENHPNFKPISLKGQLKHALMGRGLADLLRYADRNSMANSIEVRLPFLDHQLIEFVFSLPNEYLIKDGWTKYLLRMALEDCLPKKVAWRKDKIGFRPPQEKWMETTEFNALLENAKEKLIYEKIISKEYQQLNWQYIMLAAYL